MTRSTPTRRSQQISSPERTYLSSFLNDDRNTDLSHQEALDAARSEHERVRNAALQAYKRHEIEQHNRRIQEDARREQERLRAEAAVVAEELRLRELRKKSVPKPPPEPEPVPEPPRPKEVAASKPVMEAKKADAPAPAPIAALKAPAALTTTNNVFGNQNKPAPSNPFAPVQKSTEQSQTPAPLPNGLAKQPTPVAAPTSAASASPAPKAPAGPTQSSIASLNGDRYVQIHQRLKKLRKDLTDFSKTPGSPLKGQLGTFRREIRVAVGQLTATKGANAAPTAKILNALNAALSGNVPSPAIEMKEFVTEDRQPVEGAPNNDATLPALFIYLLNICAKGIINQFINECGANPKAADPIGVFTAHIFSRSEYQWRGQSLIDILMSKFRVVCPVLFGKRGSDTTIRGRTNLGWKKDGEAWTTEQNHSDRMTGLGAGFASIALRDFSKTSKTNPYPPSWYWIALAGIVNTPPGETSNTQCVVLRSMIQGHEARIFSSFGNAGLVALRLAIIEFPKKAPEKAAASGSLRALAEVFKSEHGLILA